MEPAGDPHEQEGPLLFLALLLLACVWAGARRLFRWWDKRSSWSWDNSEEDLSDMQDAARLIHSRAPLLDEHARWLVDRFRQLPRWVQQDQLRAARASAAD